MTQIVVLDGFTENPGDLSWAGLEALGQLRVYPRTKPEEIIPRIGQADIVYTNKTPITRETLLACPSIRMVSVLATGYNVVDVAACQELGILVTNIPTYGTTAVAQFTIALLLEICHQIGHHSQAVKEAVNVLGRVRCGEILLAREQRGLGYVRRDDMDAGEQRPERAAQLVA